MTCGIHAAAVCTLLQSHTLPPHCRSVCANFSHFHRNNTLTRLMSHNAVLAVVGAHSHTLQQLWRTCAHTQAAPYLWTAKFVVQLHVNKQLLSKLIWLFISCTACLVAVTVFPLGCWCGRNRAGEQGWLLQFKPNQWTIYSRWNVSEIHWKIRRNESLGPWIYEFIL